MNVIGNKRKEEKKLPYSRNFSITQWYYIAGVAKPLHHFLFCILKDLDHFPVGFIGISHQQRGMRPGNLWFHSSLLEQLHPLQPAQAWLFPPLACFPFIKNVLVFMKQIFHVHCLVHILLDLVCLPGYSVWLPYAHFCLSHSSSLTPRYPLI